MTGHRSTDQSEGTHGWIIGWVVLALIIAAVIVLVILPAKWKVDENARHNLSSARLHDLGMMMNTYQAVRKEDGFGDHFPTASSWMSDLTPYLDADQSMDELRTSLIMPERGPIVAMNSLLSGISPDAVRSPATTPLFYWSASGGVARPSSADLIFTSGDRAYTIIHFVDGHTEGYNRVDIGDLTWEP